MHTRFRWKTVPLNRIQPAHEQASEHSFVRVYARLLFFSLALFIVNFLLFPSLVLTCILSSHVHEQNVCVIVEQRVKCNRMIVATAIVSASF